MNSRERVKRIVEVERTVGELQRKGWRMEKVEHVDEDGEPFRTTITLACEMPSALGGQL